MAVRPYSVAPPEATLFMVWSSSAQTPHLEHVFANSVNSVSQAQVFAYGVV